MLQTAEDPSGGRLAGPDDTSVCQNLEPETWSNQPNSFCYCKDCEIGGLKKFGREHCYCPGCNDCTKFPLSLPCEKDCDPQTKTEVNEWVECYCSVTDNQDFLDNCCDADIPIEERTPLPQCVPICVNFRDTPGCPGDENVSCDL